MNNITISPEQRKLLDEHLRLVLEINKNSNLTRIVDWEQGQLLHIEDSLVGLPEFLEAPTGFYADLGTGGGFPGLPLSIMSDRETLLVDSVKKKTDALDTIISDLGLSERVSTYNGRAEELALEKPAYFSVITARALSALPSLLELVSPLLKVGGWFICYKGKPEENEISHAINLEEKLGLKLISHRETLLSDNETHREIIVFEKTHEARVKLPRRPGMAQKRPYKN
ncbi:MAG: 16S rRNA (guanine(527)-N(7))-methyltransferase RsmG [Anaerotardibacter sp.]